MSPHSSKRNRIQIGVIGAGECSGALSEMAEIVGCEIAARGATLLCGGLAGVMEGAAKGARSAGGTVIGILPGDDPHGGNEYLSAAVATGFGHGRNVLIPRSSDGVIAIAGGNGTLSEIGFALKMGIPLIGLSTWDLGGTFPSLDDPVEAVDLLFERMKC